MLSGEPWGKAAQLINQDDAVRNFPSINGAGQTIAVLDTGVDWKHSALGGAFGGNAKVIAGYDFQSKDGDPMSDSNAHGTGIAGIAAANGYVYKGYYNQGIAPGAKIIALRQHNTWELKSALDWVAANRTKYNIVAVNMNDFGGTSALIYKDVLKSLIASGVFVSHASGNGGASRTVGTAFDPADFAVGSVDLSGGISSFTQRGSELDLLAPGNQVTLPYYDVGSKQHIYVDTAWGTSWSSPAAVGAAALIKQIDPRFTPMQIMSILKDSGAPVYDSATRLTYKRLDLNAALALAYARRNGTSTPQQPAPSTPTPVPAGQSAFSGTPFNIAADSTLEVEDFDNGGEGVAYHDLESKNLGNSGYRTSQGVDLVDNAGGRQVGFTKAGEWIEYTVKVAATGTFNITTLVSSMNAGGKFHIEVDGVDKTGQLSVGNTGSWTKFASVTKTGVSLTAGQHVVRLKMDSVGSLGYTGNFDAIRFQQTSAPVVAATPITLNGSAFAAQGGVATSGKVVGYLDQGDWIKYKGINFGTTGFTKFTARIASANAGRKIEIRLGSGTGQVIGTLTVSATGGWGVYKEQSTTLSKVTGTHDVYLTFAGGTGVGNVEWIRFS